MRTRYIQIDGVLVEVPKDYTPEPRCDIHIMKDISPYRSMIDGSIISSRSRHREHLRDHGCIEIGNDSSIKNPKPKPLQSPPGLKDDILRAVAEVEQKQRR